jgi:hypothetical protein
MSNAVNILHPSHRVLYPEKDVQAKREFMDLKHTRSIRELALENLGVTLLAIYA